MIHLIDSNVYIHAFRDARFGVWLREFHRAHLPRLFLSAVVAHELFVGAGNASKLRSLQQGLVEPFRARRRLHVPARQTWEMAATIDRRLQKQRNLGSKLKARSFANDILIAATARELGAVIITENIEDFNVIGSVLDIQSARPEC